MKSLRQSPAEPFSANPLTSSKKSRVLCDFATFTKSLPHTILHNTAKMSTDARNKKRKSADSTTSAIKKVKTSPVAEKPLKSALKKSSKVETTTTAIKGNGKTATTTTKAKKSGDKPAKVTKKKTVTPAPAPVEADIGSTDDEEDATALSADQTADLLAGFSSSEDEDEADEADAIALSKIPNVPTTELVKKEISKATSSDPDAAPGTIHVSRLPHGFYEAQMRAYFSQFGEITHLRLARNARTGKGRHFAFVEFGSSGVADIVAKTMDKYLLFGHLLQVRRVSQEEVGDGVEFWKGEGKKRVVPRNRLEGAKLRRGTGREGWEKRVEREEKKRSEKAAKMKELGYEFDMPAVKTVDSVPEQKKIGNGKAEAEPVGPAESENIAEPEAVKAVEAPVVVKEMEVQPGKVTVTAEKSKKRSASTAPAVKEAKATKSKKTKRSA